MGDGEDLCFINGAYRPLAEARISPLDRGFLFGDGVYEVIPVYSGRPFRLQAHLSRLRRSLDEARLPSPYSDAEWASLLTRIIDSHGGGDQSLYLQVTRGAPDLRDHAFPDGERPTVFVMSSPLRAPEARGRSVILVDDIRWRRCDIKTVSLLPNVLLRQQAIEAGADEAVLIRDGFITEGAASNLFVVEGGALVTPPKSPLLLPGITRDLVVELAEANGLECRQENISLARFRSADEVWLSSSTKEVIPVTSVDGQPVGDGRPGPVWWRMRELYDAFKADLADPGKREAISTS
ncbi:D-amino acid aminotransferase [Ectothiorhodospiraceae bacterium WFHF3C12]|nr:D-amino acid aminotransferase [Ectothiorhodospiraceae bacterium WFHF3C12]